jgi:hypothetical protein
LETNHHSPERHLIELGMAHHELDVRIDLAGLPGAATDDLQLRRLKKQRLALRDEIVALQRSLSPDQSA